jgi:protein SCO1
MNYDATTSRQPITTELQLASFVDCIKKSPGSGSSLLPYLREQHPLYNGLSAGAVTRMRGYILHAFLTAGLPREALIYVYEELESGRDAYLVAAAAMALRGSKSRRQEMTGYVLAAIDNIKYFDGPVSFEKYATKWPLKKYTSARQELFTSLAWLGAYARPHLEDLRALNLDLKGRTNLCARSQLKKTIQSIESDPSAIDSGCCHGKNDSSTLRSSGVPEPRALKRQLQELILEDHNNEKVLFRDFFMQRCTLVAFFYTRCDNPLKCSLTITRLAALQNHLDQEGLTDQISIAAITYDPNYDLPHRIKIYAQARGLRLYEHVRMFRVPQGFSTLQQYFDLGVNYAGGVVNRHVIELYLLDGQGNISHTFQREKINPGHILSRIKQALREEKQPPRSQLKTAWQNFTSMAFPALVLFLPKCPLCFAAYLSLLGVTGMQLLPYTRYLFPLIVLAIGINLYAIFRAARGRNGLLPFFLCASGALLVVLFGHFAPSRYGTFSGLVLLFSGSILNSLPFVAYLKLKNRFSYSRVVRRKIQILRPESGK